MVIASTPCRLSRNMSAICRNHSFIGHRQTGARDTGVRRSRWDAFNAPKFINDRNARACRWPRLFVFERSIMFSRAFDYSAALPVWRAVASASAMSGNGAGTPRFNTIRHRVAVGTSGDLATNK